MPCCLMTFSAFFPRIALLLMWILAYSEGVFNTFLWPVLGFFFMPYATCAYTISVRELGALQGWGMALFIVAVVLDIGSHGGTGYYGPRYQRFGAHVERR